MGQGQSLSFPAGSKLLLILNQSLSLPMLEGPQEDPWKLSKSDARTQTDPGL